VSARNAKRLDRPQPPRSQIMTHSQDAAFPAFIEHRVPRGRGSLYVRDFPGSGPAFVVLHGFPDNSHIYDDLIPHLVSAGRRTVAMDFLGFGASDKPEDALYSFEQQLGDLEAVVEALELEEIIPVGHDAGGPTAVNFALKHPDRTAAVTLMNAFYGDAPGLRVPELDRAFLEQGAESAPSAFPGKPAAVRLAARLSARPDAGRSHGVSEDPLQRFPPGRSSTTTSGNGRVPVPLSRR
jgi:Predicted hydrolases or acyltransferases (alpha/beta hydrolase superfamily)